MFSLLSCASGFFALCASMSCESRSAHAIPAGPPPTITTSASICGRSTPSSGLRKTNIQKNLFATDNTDDTDQNLKDLFRSVRSVKSVANGSRPSLCFFDLFHQRRNDVEQIPDHAKVRDLEDRRLGILVDGDDGA